MPRLLINYHCLNKIPDFKLHMEPLAAKFFASTFRLMVPWSTEESWTLEVLAYWSGEFSSTPLWLYIKRAGLPSTTDFDKT